MDSHRKYQISSHGTKITKSKKGLGSCVLKILTCFDDSLIRCLGPSFLLIVNNYKGIKVIVYLDFVMRLLLIFFLFPTFLSAKPTDERSWTSSVGSKIVAVATSLEDDKVSFQTNKGRSLLIPLSKLSQADQEFLRNHFTEEAEELAEPVQPTRPAGEVIGPIQATPKSSYLYYLPATLPPGGKAPLLFWTGAGPGNPNKFKRFTRALDLTGVAMAVSVEAQNGRAPGGLTNLKHTKNCLAHIGETLPIDPERVFFSGSSGGGASAFENAGKIPCLGAQPFLAYVPDGIRLPKNGLYYIAGGAKDFNRYCGAEVARDLGDRATHRLYTRGHTLNDREYAEDGVLWLYTRHLFEKRSEYLQEAKLFEPRLMQYLKKQASEKPHEAYFWTDHLLNRCEIPSSLKGQVTQLHEELSQEATNARYLEGRKALVTFSKNYLAEIKGDSKRNHTTKKITNAAQELVSQFQDVPAILAIAEHLTEPTE